MARKVLLIVMIAVLMLLEIGAFTLLLCERSGSKYYNQEGMEEIQTDYVLNY